MTQPRGRYRQLTFQVEDLTGFFFYIISSYSVLLCLFWETVCDVTFLILLNSQHVLCDLISLWFTTITHRWCHLRLCMLNDTTGCQTGWDGRKKKEKSEQLASKLTPAVGSLQRNFHLVTRRCVWSHWCIRSVFGDFVEHHTTNNTSAAKQGAQREEG